MWLMQHTHTHTNFFLHEGFCAKSFLFKAELPLHWLVLAFSIMQIIEAIMQVLVVKMEALEAILKALEAKCKSSEAPWKYKVSGNTVCTFVF